MSLEIITREPLDAPRPTPLLFVHGILHGAWCYDEYWLPFFAERGYVASALSLRGHGRSSGQARWAGMWDYVDDMAQAADQIERQFGARPAVIGHSMGGWAVQLYLQKHSAPAAVLLASVPVGGAAGALLKIAARFPSSMTQSLFSQSFAPLVEAPSAVRWLFFGESMGEDEVARHQARLGEESWRLLGEAVLVRPDAGRVPYVPMLVLSAEQDTLFSLDEGRATAKAYGADFEALPAAHDIMLDPNWRQGAQKVLAWLERHGL
jgi:pimeloyl-ACP methyl ester carboxylesterase